jgi:hypothetical protein
MIPVEGHRGLYRDEKTNAILNCNESEYDEYLKVKNNILNEKNEIESLKNEIKEIKSLLSELIKNKL